MLTRILRFTLVGALAAPLVYGQTDSGRIVGTITDASGAVVPNASVTVVNEKTGQERKITGDSTGTFMLPNLPVATYKLTASANGFAAWETTGLPLSVGQERSVKIVLQPASVSSSVTVASGELSVLETSSAAVSANINSREVAQLPQIGRASCWERV